jgi:hypothetical protein
MSAQCGKKKALRCDRFSHLVVDKGSEGEVVEEVGEKLPDVGVAVLSQAFVVEAIHLSYLARLMVPSEDGYTLAISDLARRAKREISGLADTLNHGATKTSDLERDEEGDGLDRVVPAVDIVAHEEVVGVRRVSTDPEQLGQVVLEGEKGARTVTTRSLGRGQKTHSQTGHGCRRRR